MNRKSLVNHAMVLVSLCAALLFGYWLIESVLAPVPQKWVPPTPTAATFKSPIDLKTQPMFQSLQPISAPIVTPSATGRSNPFLPTDHAQSQVATSTR